MSDLAIAVLLVWAGWQTGHLLLEAYQIARNGLQDITPCGEPLCVQTWCRLALKAWRKVRNHYRGPENGS